MKVSTTLYEIQHKQALFKRATRVTITITEMWNVFLYT